MRRGFLLETTKKGTSVAPDACPQEQNSSGSPRPLLDSRRSYSSSESEPARLLGRCQSESSSESESPPVLLNASSIMRGEQRSGELSSPSLDHYGKDICDENEYPPMMSRYGHIGRIVDMAQHSVESMSRGFTRPRCETDLFNTLRGSEREDPRCISRFMDLHIWCVDHQNHILDYPTEQIESFYWTNDVVYRPFDAKLVAMIYNDVIHYAKKCETYINLISKMSQEEKMKAIKDNTFPERNCLWRALALQNSEPSKYAVVFGSMGFRQENGEIFWEYG